MPILMAMITKLHQLIDLIFLGQWTQLNSVTNKNDLRE